MIKYVVVENKINPKDNSRILVLDIPESNELVYEGVIINQNASGWVNNTFIATEPQSVDLINYKDIKPTVKSKFTYKGISFIGHYLNSFKLGDFRVMVLWADVTKGKSFNTITVFIPIKRKGRSHKYLLPLTQEKL